MKAKKALICCELFVLVVFTGVPIFLASCIKQEVNDFNDPYLLPRLPYPPLHTLSVAEAKEHFLEELDGMIKTGSLEPYFNKIYSGRFYLQNNYSFSSLFPGLYMIDQNTLDTGRHYNVAGEFLTFREFDLDYYYKPHETKELLVYEVPAFVNERLCLAFIYSQNGRLPNLRGLCILESLRKFVSLKEDLTSPIPNSFSVFKCNDILNPEDFFYEGREMKYSKPSIDNMDFNYFTTLELADNSHPGGYDKEKKYIFFFRD